VFTRPAWYSRLIGLCAFVGVYPERLGTLALRLPRFLRDARQYRRAARDRFPFQWSAVDAILTDFGAEAGVAYGQYFYQDLWAARRIFAARPPLHVDVGSRIDGFVAHVLSFMPVTVVDIRPLTSSVDGLTFRQGDMCRLDFPSDSIASISCLHAIEHVGLGRYGDPVDPDGCFTALRELGRVLAPGGRLYLGTPIGREQLAFNNGRIFDPRTITTTLSALRLVSFDAVDDDERLVANADPAAFTGARNSCGLFEFTKD
jgi:SAM-dependent methyltransferase